MATLVFFGNERLVSGLKTTDAPILRALIKSGHRISAVVSHHNEGASRNNRSLEVADVAKEHGIPILLPDRPSDIYDELVSFHADAAILVAYGRIIPQKVIDIFPKGIINVHPSLLPKYRGSTPIESAILHGDNETGVSIMQLSAGMDEGPVYAQETITLNGSETKFDLYNKQIAISTPLLLSILPKIIDGSLQPIAQDNDIATYSKLLTKADSALNPQNISAEQAARQVRAYLGFPKTKLSILDHEIIITKAHVSDEQKSALDIACSDGLYLSIDELTAPSGRHMNAQAFINGYTAG